MGKQKVFFFAPQAEATGDMLADGELSREAARFVAAYGARCLDDRDTPTFVRQLAGRGNGENELPRAG